MLLFSSDVLIEHYIFQIPQMFLVLSPCPNKFLYFTSKCLKFDSSSYSIFETNFSVPLVKFLQFFQNSKETFEFCCTFMHLFPNHKILHLIIVP